MKCKYLIIFFVVFTVFSCSENTIVEYREISNKELINKIKGAWAGKMIGVMHGIGMEFEAVGHTFEDSIPFETYYLERALNEDDIYVQLSFLSTMEKNQGLKTSVNKIMEDFAYAEFPLCHANLQLRKNFLDGIYPPKSGSPEYNMHADDIDFQIESDYIGFINPGMPYSAVLMADSVGRSMAYGDGLYGGMFVSAMHSIAFFENDAKIVVEKALRCIPQKSEYAKAIQVVLEGYKKNSSDWRKTWEIIQRRWGDSDVCVPYHPFNIDAAINGAFIAMGLIFGDNNMEKTIEVAIRCGQDTDCNASNAAAVLGIIHGYDAIEPAYTSYISNMADKLFLHTDYSYNKVVLQTLVFAKECILNNGGREKDDFFLVRIQEPKCHGELEQSFKGKKMTHQIQMTEVQKYKIVGDWEDFVYGGGDDDLYKVSTNPGDYFEVQFKGSGISILGSYNLDGGTALLYIDGRPYREFNCYYRSEAGKWMTNRQHIVHAMDLEDGEHTLRIEVLDTKHPNSTGHKIYIEKVVVFN